MALNINPENVEVQQSQYDNSPIPSGEYLVQTVFCEDDPDCKSASGNEYSRVRLRFQILEGEHSNRLLFKDAIYDHPNETAAKIGEQFLKSLYVASSCEGNITPESLLAGRPFTASVKVEERQGYAPRSEVKWVKSGGPVEKPSSSTTSGEAKPEMW